MYLLSVDNIEGFDVFSYLVDYNAQNDYGSYVIYNGEDKITFGEEANELVYYDDKHIFYLESYDSEDHEGDLMMFDGEKSILIDEGVQLFQ